MTKHTVSIALMAAVAEALASGQGPDGTPSRMARRRAKRILDWARENPEELDRLAGDGTDEGDE